jgi:hypothetical protein
LAAVGAGGALELPTVAAAGPLLCESSGAFGTPADGDHSPLGSGGSRH